MRGLLSASTVRLTTGKCVAQRGGANNHFAILLRALAPREKCKAGIKLAKRRQFMASMGKLHAKNYFALLKYVCHHSALDHRKLHGTTWRWWHFHCSSLILSLHSTGWNCKLVSCWKSAHISHTPRFAAQHINIVDKRRKQEKGLVVSPARLKKTWQDMRHGSILLLLEMCQWFRNTAIRADISCSILEQRIVLFSVMLLNSMCSHRPASGRHRATLQSFYELQHQKKVPSWYKVG